MEKKKLECQETYHHFFALEPFVNTDTGDITVLVICTACKKPVRYDFNLHTTDPIKVIE